MPISADHEVSWAATWVTTTVAGHACTVFGDESQTMLMSIVATAVLAAGTRLFMSAIKHCQDHKQTRFALRRIVAQVLLQKHVPGASRSSGDDSAAPGTRNAVIHGTVHQRS